MIALIAAAVLLSPLIALFAAGLRATVLFWPVMVLAGALHSHFPDVPPISWVQSWLIIAIVSLLVPTSTNTSDD